MASLAQRGLLALGLSLALAACGSPTPYQAAGEESRYGYAEERLDPETWRLQFAGNSLTPREQVEDYLLFRAAEIAKREGARSFVVLGQDTERKTFYTGTVQPSYGALSAQSFFIHGRRRSLFHYRPQFSRAYLRPIDRYTAYGTIRVFAQEPPEGLGVPFETDAVIATLGPRVARPPVVP